MLKTFNQLDILLKNDAVMQKTCMFDYIGIQNYLENLSDKSYKKNNVNIFQKAYILFKLNRIYESYIELERISNNIRNKNNLLFVISEYNRLQLGGVINKNDLQLFVPEALIDREIQRIHNSIKGIQIEYLINNYLTNEELKIIKNKLSNDNLLSYKNKLLKLSDSIDEKVINLSGNKFYHDDFYKDYVLNYIFIEHNSLYKDIFYYSIKTMLQDNKNIREDLEKDTILNHPRFLGEPKEHEFDYFDVYLIIEFLTPKQLKKIFDISDTNIIRFNCKEKLFQAYQNLINSVIKLNLQNEFKYKTYVRNFFIIFSKIDINYSEFTSIITLYIRFLKKYKIYYNDSDLYKYLMDFIIEQFNNSIKRKAINITILEKLLIFIYTKTIKKYDEHNFLITNALNRVIRNLSNIIKELDNKYECPLKTLINIENISYLKNFYIPMYFMLNNNLKNNIKKIIHDSLKKEFTIELFFVSSLNKIIKINDEYENNLIKETISKIKLYYKIKENPKTKIYGNQVYKLGTDKEKNDVENAISSIADLINFGIIKNVSKYMILLKYTEFNSITYLNFVINMKNFDYNKFEVSYLHFLTQNKIKELKNILKYNKSAKNIVKEKVLNQISFNNKINDIYIKNKILYILFNEPRSKHLL